MSVRESPKIEPLALGAKDAAKALGISERALQNATQPKGPIPSIKLGERRLYPVDALREWLRREWLDQIATENNEDETQ